MALGTNQKPKGLASLPAACFAHISRSVCCSIHRCAAQAAPNGYTQIPIAKVFGKRGRRLLVFGEPIGLQRGGRDDAVRAVQPVRGGSRLPERADYDRSLLGNAKYLLVHDPGHLPDVAAGMTNIARHQRADPYLVATTQPGAIGVSLGLTRPTAGGFVGMGGVAYNLNPNAQFVADYVDGRGAYTTVGVIDAITPTDQRQFCVCAPELRAGDCAASARSGSADRDSSLNLAYVFHARHGKDSVVACGGGGGSKNPTAAGAGGAGGG